MTVLLRPSLLIIKGLEDESLMPENKNGDFS